MYSIQFWKTEVRDQGAGIVGFWWGATSWFIEEADLLCSGTVEGCYCHSPLLTNHLTKASSPKIMTLNLRISKQILRWCLQTLALSLKENSAESFKKVRGFDCVTDPGDSVFAFFWAFLFSETLPPKIAVDCLLVGWCKRVTKLTL